MLYDGAFAIETMGQKYFFRAQYPVNGLLRGSIVNRTYGTHKNLYV